MSRSQITDNLYISDITSAREESTGQFDKVITVCQEEVSGNVGCEYSYYNMSDGTTKAYGGKCNFELFEQAANELYHALSDGMEVLIHCHAGRSRSVSVSIAALSRLNDLEYYDAYDKISNNRGFIAPDQTLAKFARKYIEIYTT